MPPSEQGSVFFRFRKQHSDIGCGKNSADHDDGGTEQRKEIQDAEISEYDHGKHNGPCRVGNVEGHRL